MCFHRFFTLRVRASKGQHLLDLVRPQLTRVPQRVDIAHIFVHDHCSLDACLFDVRSPFCLPIPRINLSISRHAFPVGHPPYFNSLNWSCLAPKSISTRRALFPPNPFTELLLAALEFVKRFLTSAVRPMRCSVEVSCPQCTTQLP